MFAYLICTHTRIRYCTNHKKIVFNTYGYEIQRRSPKGPTSLRNSFHDNDSDQNLYVHTPNVSNRDNGKDPVVSIQLTHLVEKEEPEIFINEAAAASESENGVSLSKDIARELGEVQETQVLKMSFDEPGEETKL